MYTGAKVDRWAIVSFSNLEQGLVNHFGNDLVAMCVSKGMVCFVELIIWLRQCNYC